MHKYISVFFLVTFTLCACSGKKSNGAILDHGEMISLLTDLHIADGRMLNFSQNPDTLYKYGTARYLNIFKRHHTDSTQFRNSYKYYTTQPVELQAIYDKVLGNIKRKTDSLNKIDQEKVKKNAIPAE